MRRPFSWDGWLLSAYSLFMRLASNRWHNKRQFEKLSQTRIDLMEVYESSLYSLMNGSWF